MKGPQRGRLPLELAVVGDAPAEVLGIVQVAAVEQCVPCKGFGLVRGEGRRQGLHYRSLSGAQQALENGRAVDCPACAGLGAIPLEGQEGAA